MGQKKFSLEYQYIIQIRGETKFPEELMARAESALEKFGIFYKMKYFGWNYGIIMKIFVCGHDRRAAAKIKNLAKKFPQLFRFLQNFMEGNRPIPPPTWNLLLLMSGPKKRKDKNCSNRQHQGYGYVGSHKKFKFTLLFQWKHLRKWHHITGTIG